MQINFKRTAENEIVKMVIDNGIEINFSYIDFINKLFHNERIENVNFEGEYSEFEKTKITDLLVGLYDIAKPIEVELDPDESIIVEQ